VAAKRPAAIVRGRAVKPRRGRAHLQRPPIWINIFLIEYVFGI
jgi:hypothetical protein